MADREFIKRIGFEPWGGLTDPLKHPSITGKPAPSRLLVHFITGLGWDEDTAKGFEPTKGYGDQSIDLFRSPELFDHRICNSAIIVSEGFLPDIEHYEVGLVLIPEPSRIAATRTGREAGALTNYNPEALKEEITRYGVKSVEELLTQGNPTILTGLEIGLYGKEWESQASPGRVVLGALAYVLQPDGMPSNHYCYEWFKIKAAELDIPLIGLQAVTKPFHYSTRLPLASQNLTSKLELRSDGESNSLVCIDSDKIIWIDPEQKLVFEGHKSLLTERDRYLRMSKVASDDMTSHQIERPLNTSEINELLSEVLRIEISDSLMEAARKELIRQLSLTLANDNLHSVEKACAEHKEKASSSPQNELLVPNPVKQDTRRTIK